MLKKANLKLVVNNGEQPLKDNGILSSDFYQNETIYVDANKNLLKFWEKEREKINEN